MNQERSAQLERLQDLLAAQATEGLSRQDQQELDGLRTLFDDHESASLEHAAAALSLAWREEETHEMPPTLREKLESDGVGWMARQKAMALSNADSTRPKASQEENRGAFRFPLPWALAAACLLLAVLGWWPRTGGPSAPVDVAAMRSDMIDTSPDARQIAWQVHDQSIGQVGGDVVWSNQDQHGYMRFDGLAVNNPTLYQYQLWIFDEKRQTYDAVDGGVFDIDSTGAAVIPIDAKLRVFEPTLFAITTEPPGGVVKHDPELDPDRFRIILVAPVDA